MTSINFSSENNDMTNATTTMNLDAANENSSDPRASMFSQSSSRFETFTEAVPLSLSSMAHASLSLQEGVLDGVKQVLQHTMLQCVNFARNVYPPHQWSFRDLATTRYAWTPVKGELTLSDLPFFLEKLKFKHQYSRNAWIYLKPAIPEDLTSERELELLMDDGWLQQVGILGRVSLLYTSTEPLTPGEMDGTDTEDIPPCILYKVVVEYRSKPPTGKAEAIQAEELSMLSFGGSPDDDIKYGALASLYDETAKYVLEIYSVRGKRYKFDLMDATLSNGTIPHLPSSQEGDPFVKSLCVTVTDHRGKQTNDATNGTYAITRMNLTMEGKLRHYSKGKDECFEDLPAFNYMAEAISQSFLKLNPNPPIMVTASPSGHTLLMDPELAGRIYVNGCYVTTWGGDPEIGSHGMALFGMDLHSIPFRHGRIVDYETMKFAYAQLWHELLVDARLLHMNLARKLLYRLMRGQDPESDDDDDLYDDDEEEVVENPDVHKDALESIVLAAPQYDVVGIAAKALATRFAMEFGTTAFPCAAHETEWVRTILPNKEPVVVPQRLINVLRRGGYFDAQKTVDLLWFTENRQISDGTEREIVNIAVEFLVRAGCTDVDADNIVLCTAPLVDNVIVKDAVCRYNPAQELYVVHQDFFTAPVEDYQIIGQDVSISRIKGYLLGMYIAKAHPFGKVLACYVVRNNL